MKTFTIGWLNKCRCGNKLHSVKTARGNDTGLWDDDAVKCNSCGRGGVIQVCEGQARVLWETDEEMTENKPMSTITKQWLQQKIAEMEATRDEIPFGLGEDGTNTLAALRIALASLEAEAVAVSDDMAYAFHHALSDSSLGADEVEEIKTGLRAAFANVTAPPAPVSVPDAYVRDERGRMMLNGRQEPRIGYGAGWNGYRAAMLQGAEPVERLGAEFEEALAELIDSEMEPVTTAYKLPEGWVAVPVEPTEDMIVNGFESEPDESFSDEKEWEEYEAMSGCQQAAHRAKLCWAAMIAAAPQQEETAKQKK